MNIGITPMRNFSSFAFKLYLAALCLSAVKATAQTTSLSFSRIQPDTFGGSMSLSNAWGDYDMDGDLDLVVVFKTGDVRLYNNEFGGFINVGPDLGLPIGGKERRAVAWGDYDGDGYLDLYIGSNRQGNELFHNDRSQGFTEVTAEFQVGVPEVSTRQISWVDYDNNGTLDLFVADRVGANLLFSNNAGKFVEVVSSFSSPPKEMNSYCLRYYDPKVPRRMGNSVKSPARFSALACMASCISCPCIIEAFQIAM